MKWTAGERVRWNWLLYCCACVKEKVLLEPMYEAPGSDIVSVVITQDAVAEGKPVDYVRKPRFLSSH